MMVRPNGSRGAVSLLPFCGFSPVLKSICLDFYALPPSQICDLILSFLLLEDLSVTMGGSRSIHDDYDSSRPSTADQPPNQPMTGFLELSRCTRLGFISNWLLSLPGGIHFCKLALDCTRSESRTRLRSRRKQSERVGQRVAQ